MASVPPSRNGGSRSTPPPTPHWSDLNWLQRGVVLLEALMVSASSPRSALADTPKATAKSPPKPTAKSAPKAAAPAPSAAPSIPSDPINPGGSPALVRRRPGPSLPVQLFRTTIIGVGLGAIVGTVMLAVDPSLRQTASPSRIALNGAAEATANQLGATRQAVPLPESPLKRRSDVLQNKLKDLVSKRSGNVSPRIAIVDLDTGDFASWNDTQPSIAASTIKVPVLVAFFQEVDAGRIRLDEPLVMKKELVASEAGVMQYKPVGTKFSALETVTQMIVISDNTATNLAIDRLGGAAKLNARFKQWGLEQTVINNLLPDLGGTNTVSARDMAMLFGLLHRGELVSLRSRDRLLAILRNTKSRGLLPNPLRSGATIAHKTGTLAKALGDVGMVDLPNGRRYAIAALTHRPPNDGNAGTLIREVSSLSYQHFSNLTPAPR